MFGFEDDLFLLNNMPRIGSSRPKVSEAMEMYKLVCESERY